MEARHIISVANTCGVELIPGRTDSGKQGGNRGNRWSGPPIRIPIEVWGPKASRAAEVKKSGL